MDNTTTQNGSGMMNGMPPQMKPARKVGPIVGVLIIVVVLIAAALYFFTSRTSTPAPAPEVQQQQAVQQPVQTQPAAAVKSDDINAIQSDLNATFTDVDYSF